jgi:hypothetical protein
MKPFDTSMFGKNHDGVCYSLKDNHENGHMQTIKHAKDLSGTWGSQCSKSLFIGAKVFMHATKKKCVFLIYIFPTPVVGSNQHEIHFH